MLQRLRPGGKRRDASIPGGGHEAEHEGKYAKAPILLRQRSSTWFIALAVGFGVLVDLSSYSLAVPVIPFRLQALGYGDIGGKTGWLVSAYAGGLIVSSPVIAVVGARYKNRQIPLFLGLLFMAAAVVLFMEAESYALMVVARILQGFSGTTLWTIGLALVTDSVPEERVGTVLGAVMIGFSCGQAIGPPVGGVLYARMGYRAPFVFSLILVGIDLLLRVLLIEKHIALKYIQAGHDIPNFEAPGYVDPRKTTDSQETVATSPEPEATTAEGKAAPEGKAVSLSGSRKIPSHWLGLWEMLKSPRAMTTILLTLLNGFIVGALQDTGQTIYLEEQYGLTSFGAGLVFLGFVVPTFFASPIAGWAVDRVGTKWIMAAGTVLSIPMYPLLIIKGPLALFIFFLALLGVAVSAFITPTTVDLAMVSARVPNVTTAHVFSLFNLAFSVGSLLGPIVGGQLISHTGIETGWIAITSLSAGLTFVLLPAIVIWVGDPSPWRPWAGKSPAVEAEEMQEGGDIDRSAESERTEATATAESLAESPAERPADSPPAIR
ncbi:hypothetical protein JCM8202_003377 [Rhodotorula sphaerocarpa]